MERPHLNAFLQILNASPNEDSRRQVLHCMQEMEKDRKETCIHCREVWYAIHYKDGVCHGCQQKRLPGRREIEAARRRKVRLIFWLVKLPIWTAVIAAIYALAC